MGATSSLSRDTVKIDFSPFARETLPIALEYAQGLGRVELYSFCADMVSIHTYRHLIHSIFFRCSPVGQNGFRETTARPSEVFLENWSCPMVATNTPDQGLAMRTPSDDFYACTAPRLGTPTETARAVRGSSMFWSLKHASERAKERCLSIETLAPNHMVMGQCFVQ